MVSFSLNVKHMACHKYDIFTSRDKGNLRQSHLASSDEDHGEDSLLEDDPVNVHMIVVDNLMPVIPMCIVDNAIKSDAVN